MAKAGTEQVRLDLFVAHVDGRFAPIDLHGISRHKPQWNKNLLRLAFRLHVVNKTADSGLSPFKPTLFHKALIDSPGCVLLLLNPFGFVLIQTCFYE